MSEPKIMSRRGFLKFGIAAGSAVGIGIFPDKVLGASIFEMLPFNKKNLVQKAFLYDQNKCIDCRACAHACKETYHWEEGTKWRKVLTNSRGEHLSMSCNHCAEPACVDVCPVAAYTKRKEDGIVLHSGKKCVGCKYCLYACPYHAPQYGEESGKISKCQFCYTLQDKGFAPACVNACPTGALTHGEYKKLANIPGVVNEVYGLPPANLTKPSLFIVMRDSKT